MGPTPEGETGVTKSNAKAYKLENPGEPNPFRQPLPKLNTKSTKNQTLNKNIILGLEIDTLGTQKY